MYDSHFCQLTSTMVCIPPSTAFRTFARLETTLHGWVVRMEGSILKALYLREDFLQQVPKGKWRQKLWARAGLSEDLSTSTSSNTKGAYRHNPDYRSHSILEGLSTHNKSQGVSFDHARPTMTAGKRAVIPWYDHDLGMSVMILTMNG